MRPSKKEKREEKEKRGDERTAKIKSNGREMTFPSSVIADDKYAN